MKKKQIGLVMLYLMAIVSANLIVAAFGERVVIINAFLFIGLDLTTRDYLHEIWGGRGLWLKMAVLIAFGSLLSWGLNSNAGMIAVASFAAFSVAGLVDTIIYQCLGKRPFLIRVNGSNVFSSMADSLVFPTLAFGGFLPMITLGQAAAKIGGGFAWSILLRRWRT